MLFDTHAHMDDRAFDPDRERLLEEEVDIEGKPYYLGHSREYVKVAVPKSGEYGVNDILAVKAQKALQPHILLGEEIQVL